MCRIVRILCTPHTLLLVIRFRRRTSARSGARGSFQGPQVLKVYVSREENKKQAKTWRMLVARSPMSGPRRPSPSPPFYPSEIHNPKPGTNLWTNANGSPYVDSTDESTDEPETRWLCRSRVVFPTNVVVCSIFPLERIILTSKGPNEARRMNGHVRSLDVSLLGIACLARSSQHSSMNESPW